MSALQSGYAMLPARLAAALALAASFVSAQPLVNLGKPLQAPFACTEEDVQSLGLDCTSEEPCAVFLELAGLEIAGSKIFLTGNLHTATTTLASVLLASEDEGKTWTEPHPRIRSTGLDQIQFLDFERGWVAGQQIEAMPRDPFFLITTDGGKTWRQAPIFNETRYGSILQFHFDDKSSGALILDHGPGSGSDRYERYETTDGGDTWTVKETNQKPLMLKRPPAAGAAPAEWRVRADGNSRSFQLEHRQEQRWSSVAGFAVNLGVCRPGQ